jgi:hypothetical protein
LYAQDLKRTKRGIQLKRSPLIRTLVIAAAVIGIGWYALRSGVVSDGDAMRIAIDQAGSYLYRLDFKERVVGSYASRTELSSERLLIESHLAVTLPGADLQTVTERMEFATVPPYRLLGASREARSRGNALSIDIEQAGDGYQAVIRGNAGQQTHSLDWHYTLADHLGVERWLLAERPGVGSTHASRQLDFNRMEPIDATWRLLEAGADDSVWLGLVAAGEDKVFHLDANLVPKAASIAGVFTMTRVEDESGPIMPGPLAHSSAAKVALSAAIANPGELVALQLHVNDSSALVLENSGTITGPAGARTLHLERRRPTPATAEELARASGPRADLPSEHPRIRRLVRQALGASQSLDAQIANLTEFVHRHLDYRVDVNVMGVLDSLEKRVGDCTEFADLLTTLARAAGLPARTVTGLAYAEAEGPGFYLHAWTEIAIDGTWHPVDPTFGQTRIGPTHIRFPDVDSAYLRAYAAIPEMRFSVVRTVYRDRPTDPIL